MDKEEKTLHLTVNLQRGVNSTFMINHTFFNTCIGIIIQVLKRNIMNTGFTLSDVKKAPLLLQK